jgi:hypothetical protein
MNNAERRMVRHLAKGFLLQRGDYTPVLGRKRDSSASGLLGRIGAYGAAGRIFDGARIRPFLIDN